MPEPAPLSYDPNRMHWTRINPVSARCGDFFIAENMVLDQLRFCLYEGDPMPASRLLGTFSRRKFAMEAAQRIRDGGDAKQVVAEIRLREGDDFPRSAINPHGDDKMVASDHLALG